MNDPHLVRPGTTARLANVDPDAHPTFKGNKAKAAKALARVARRLGELQELLWAQHAHKVLIVLQGMDTAGKDGTIRHVFRSVNPMGVRVASFKAPTAEELAHDFLWRVHRQVPAAGEIAIFNRSHYEDVLVVRVRKLAPPGVWRKRFDQINDFERMLAAGGTTILKFFLHIDAEEQKKRLQSRLDEPSKRWKFNPDDLAERKHWPLYMKAYQDVLNRTSSPWAPWRIVPSNRKWYRNLVVAQTLVDTLARLKMRYPEPPPGLDDVIIE